MLPALALLNSREVGLNYKCAKPLRTEAKIFLEILLFGISVIDHSLSVVAVLIYENFVEVASSKEFGFKQKT